VAGIMENLQGMMGTTCGVFRVDFLPRTCPSPLQL
jgi:hypothetical protein